MRPSCANNTAAALPCPGNHCRRCRMGLLGDFMSHRPAWEGAMGPALRRPNPRGKLRPMPLSSSLWRHQPRMSDLVICAKWPPHTLNYGPQGKSLRMIRRCIKRLIALSSSKNCKPS